MSVSGRPLSSLGPDVLGGKRGWRVVQALGVDFFLLAGSHRLVVFRTRTHSKPSPD